MKARHANLRKRETGKRVTGTSATVVGEVTAGNLRGDPPKQAKC